MSKSHLKIYNPMTPDYSITNREKLANHVVESLTPAVLFQIVYDQQLDYYTSSESAFENDWEESFGND